MPSQIEPDRASPDQADPRGQQRQSAGICPLPNTSESTVEKWETGAKQPSGMALRLLMIIRKHGLQVLG
jgi:putative transcriptional regulator